LSLSAREVEAFQIALTLVLEVRLHATVPVQELTPARGCLKSPRRLWRWPGAKGVVVWPALDAGSRSLLLLFAP